MDADEIALLSAVLIDERAIPVQDPAGKDGQDPRIGVGKRLTAAEDVKEAQSNCGDAVCAAENQAHPLLMILGKRIDRCQRRRLLLRCRDRIQGLVISVPHFPVTPPQLLGGPLHRNTLSTVGGLIESLSVDAHTGRHNQALDGEFH